MDNVGDFNSIVIPLPKGNGTPPADPREALDRALLDARVTDIASMIFLQWGLVRTFYERMAWLLTSEVPHTSGQSLLEVIVIQSIQEFARSISEAPEDVNSAYVAMLRQALAVLPSVLEIDVRGKHGELWDPLQDAPLGEWMRRHEPVEFAVANDLPEAHKWTHPSQIRYAFLHRLLEQREINKLLPLLPKIISTGRPLH